MEQSLAARFKRMSFAFPEDFYNLLAGLKQKYGMDMTYIIIEAVNDWVERKASDFKRC